MRSQKARILVPEDDTHKQTITDVYNIYKSTYSKCYDSDEEILFYEVIHHLEQQSVSTFSETDSRYKYFVDDNSLKKALDAVPKWYGSLPKNFGYNVGNSLSIHHQVEDSPMNHLKDMGIETIEYVKLKIGYSYLKPISQDISSNEKSHTKALCPGLTGGTEDPIILRMLHMQYITREDYMKWVLRSRRVTVTDIKKREENVSWTKTIKSESVIARVNSTDGSESAFHTRGISNVSVINGAKGKEELFPLNMDEKRVIMLTQYEVTDQELPDDIEIFWPGKKDLERDFDSFKSAVKMNILFQQFIQKYKSGRLERLDEAAKMEVKEYFFETQSDLKRNKTTPKPKRDENKSKVFRCNYERLKEQFKDYKISQEKTLSLFENVLKEKARLEDLNLCCIVSKLKQMHKDSKEETQNDGLIWKDVVVIRSREDEATSFMDLCMDHQEEEEEEKEEVIDETKSETNENIVPEYKSMIYVTKVHPEPGTGYTEDRCKLEQKRQDRVIADYISRGGCSGYSMKDYKRPIVPQCSFKISKDVKNKGKIQKEVISNENEEETKSTQVFDDEQVLVNDVWITNYMLTQEFSLNEQSDYTTSKLRDDSLASSVESKASAASGRASVKPDPSIHDDSASKLSKQSMKTDPSNNSLAQDGLPSKESSETSCSKSSQKSRSCESVELCGQRKDKMLSMKPKDDYVTFHTDWSKYPYSERLDIIFHRHHKGYIYMTDVFEITPDLLREINRIFHKAGKFSDIESRRTALNAYTCHDPQPRPPDCCRSLIQADSDGLDLSEVALGLPPGLKSFGEDTLEIKHFLPSLSLTKLIFSSDEKTYSLPQVGNIDHVKITNFEVEKGDESNEGESSSSTDPETFNELNFEYDERLLLSQVSSVCFDSHDDDSSQDRYNTNIPQDEIDDICKKDVCEDDDDYSDIVDFIKTFRFGEELPEQVPNYEGIHDEQIVKREKGVFVDILSSKSCDSLHELSKVGEKDKQSVNSDDTLSLKDFKGFIGKSKKYEEQDLKDCQPNLTNPMIQISHCVSGELYDVLIESRKSIIQELRASFPLIYLYLALKTNFQKFRLSGKLFKYKYAFRSINKKYEIIVGKYKCQNNFKKIDPFTDNLDHYNLIYEEIFKRSIVLPEELYSMIIHYPFMRHLLIRYGFQDVGINLSFLLLFFIENDKSNKFFQNRSQELTKTMKHIASFTCTFSNLTEYNHFLRDMTLLHYFENRRFFTIDELIDRDQDWENVLSGSRTIITDRTAIKDQNEIVTNYKDSIQVQVPSGYSYCVYKLIRQFDINYNEDNLFRQFLEPDMHPSLLRNLTCQELDEIISKNCLEWCDIGLVTEIEEGLKSILTTVWESEILGINKCQLLNCNISNRYPNETAFYLRYFFSNIFQVRKEESTKEQNDSIEVLKVVNDIWIYNREFDFWHNEAFGNTITSNELLKKDNLFKFEKLFTQCFIKSIMAFYKYKIHG